MEYIASVQPEQMLRYPTWQSHLGRPVRSSGTWYASMVRIEMSSDGRCRTLHLAQRHPNSRGFCAWWRHRVFRVLCRNGQDVTPWAHNRVWWRCAAYGHSWETSVDHRSRGINCPICANRTIISGFNDLASISPELLQSWDYERNTISPSEIPPNAARKVWWKCENGHHWRCTLSNRQHGSECPYCKGRIPTRTRIVP